jgi:hypothetical protein
MINEEIRNQIHEAAIEILEVIIRFTEKIKIAFGKIKKKIV